MLAAPAPFPQAGSRAFIGTSAEPATIIRRNADGTALIRVDPRPTEGRNRDASGNRTEPFGNLFPTEDAAARAGLPRTKKRKSRSATSGPQGRPAARSDAPGGRTSEDIAPADAGAERKQ